MLLSDFNNSFARMNPALGAKCWTKLCKNYFGSETGVVFRFVLNYQRVLYQ
jgi:hypothetical protein